MLKTVLIGFGKIASNYASDKSMQKWFKYSTHVQVLVDHPEFSLTAVVDQNRTALLKAKEVWNIPEVKESVEELSNPEEFEVAIFAIPPKNRFAIIEKLPNLKAIIFEKPLATTVSEAFEIINICNNKNIIAEVNFPRRFDKKVKKSLDDLPKDLGQIKSAFAIYGNGINNNGSHLIDLARIFMGEVSWVQSLANKNPTFESPIKDDINLPFVIGFKNGSSLFTNSFNYEDYREFYFDLWGTKGRLSFLQEGLLSAYFRKKNHRFSENDKEIESDNGVIKLMDQSSAIYNLYNQLFERIINKEFNNKNLNYSLDVIKIIKKIELSNAKNDQRIFL